MAIPFEKFVTMSLEEIMSFSPAQKCECGEIIDEHPDEHYVISQKSVCSDCYFSSLSEIVEKSPIYNPTKIASRY